MVKIPPNILFCRIQNLHISQTRTAFITSKDKFCRIQNLHISQTITDLSSFVYCFVEFKIYISLKRYEKPNSAVSVL